LAHLAKLLAHLHDVWVQAQGSQPAGTCPGLGNGGYAAQLLLLGTLCICCQALPQRSTLLLGLQQLLVLPGLLLAQQLALLA
jgi:hypothetical protein